MTVVRGIPPRELAAVASDLKRQCGSGGAVKDGVVEIQGDHRPKVVARLEAQGYRVKLAGGCEPVSPCPGGHNRSSASSSSSD